MGNVCSENYESVFVHLFYKYHGASSLWQTLHRHWTFSSEQVRILVIVELMFYLVKQMKSKLSK